MMERTAISRRTVLSGAAAAGLTTVAVTGPAHASGGVVVPWLDQPPPIPEPFQDTAGNLLVWENLDTRLTPNAEFFTVKHYDLPDISRAGYRLTVDGLARHRRTLSLGALQSRPRRTVEFTLECSGNNGAPFFIGGVGNARWTGTPLHLLLRDVGPLEDATEVIFWGADRGTVTIRDNSGVLQPDPGGGLTITEQFARSMSLREAMDPDNLLCFEMNGEALPREHGYPLRLIAPGWYGVANVKWLTRIQLTDQRYAGRFMARDYVTIREPHPGQPVWTFYTVSHTQLKSAPARVVRHGRRHTIHGAAWGARIARVEVQIDGGRWQATKLDRPREREGFAWRFWSFDWGTPTAGEHTVRSRAFDIEGNMQPPPDDPALTSRRTFWESNGQITRHVVITT